MNGVANSQNSFRVMELMLNELSIQPCSDDEYQANERMTRFAQTVSTANKEGFKNIRSDLSSAEIILADGYTVHDWLNNRAVARDYRDFLYGVIIPPFINEEDEDIGDAYIETDFYFEDQANNYPKTACLGLAAAHLYETLSLSFDHHPIWCKNQLTILVEKEGNTIQHQVHNVFSRACFGQDIIRNFVEMLGEVEIIETPILPEEKSIHLADHHGKAELAAFCEKIKASPHVVEMRSTNWGGNSFIRKIHKEGVIEITLTRTARRYALWVQTTGRNYRETEAIAKILEERYS